jgi:hypothetical protein
MSINEIKWKIQRMKRGYSDSDAWNMCDYLLDIIPPMLEQFKDGDSYPAILDSAEEWNTKLDEMIEGFEAGKRYSELDYDTASDRRWQKQIDDDLAKFRKGMRVFTEYFFALWD